MARIKRYTFKVKCGYRDEFYPCRDSFEKTVRAENEDEAYMEIDYYCEINEINVIDYELLKVEKIEVAELAAM